MAYWLFLADIRYSRFSWYPISDKSVPPLPTDIRSDTDISKIADISVYHMPSLLISLHAHSRKHGLFLKGFSWYIVHVFTLKMIFISQSGRKSISMKLLPFCLKMKLLYEAKYDWKCLFKKSHKKVFYQPQFNGPQLGICMVDEIPTTRTKKKAKMAGLSIKRYFVAGYKGLVGRPWCWLKKVKCRNSDYHQMVLVT